MKKAILFFLVFFLAMSGLSAQMADIDRDLFKVMFNDDPALSGPGGTVLLGFGGELLGYALFLSGGMVISLDMDVGIALYEIGGLIMPLSGLIMQSGLSGYQSALEAKGAQIAGNFESDTWMWTYIATALGGGGFVLYLLADNFEMLLGSIITVGVGAIIEVCNMGFLRMDWVTAMNKAAREIGISGVDFTLPIAASNDNWGLEVCF